MRKAYRNANLDFCDTDYVECHGTGTELGDLVEITALSNCFLSGRERPLKIGGVSDLAPFISIKLMLSVHLLIRSGF